MKNFKVGDKVKAIDDRYGITRKSSEWEGVVTFVHDDKNFDARTTNHVHPDEIGKKYYQLDPKHFELITPETIVITNDGKITTAWLKQGKTILKTGVAKCSPDDEFSLEIGAKLALERLFEAEEPKKAVPKYKVGDIVKVVNDGKSYTTYDSWFEENNQLKIAARYVYGNSIENGEMVRILAIGKHRWDENKTICAVESIDTAFKRVYLIGIDGLKKH